MTFPATNFMCEIKMAQETEALLFQHCVEQNQNPESLFLPSTSRLKGWKQGEWRRQFLRDTACLYIREAGWALRYGGIEFVLTTPYSKQSARHGPTNVRRATAIFTDPQWTPQLMECDTTMHRGGLILQKVEGKWYAYIGYRAYANHRKLSRKHRERIRAQGGTLTPIQEGTDNDVPIGRGQDGATGSTRYLPRYTIRRVESRQG